MYLFIHSCIYLFIHSFIFIFSVCSLDCFELFKKHSNHGHAAKPKCPQCRSPFAPSATSVVLFARAQQEPESLASADAADVITERVPGFLSYAAASELVAKVKGQYSSKVSTLVACVLELLRYVQMHRTLPACFHMIVSFTSFCNCHELSWFCSLWSLICIVQCGACSQVHCVLAMGQAAEHCEHCLGAQPRAQCSAWCTWCGRKEKAPRCGAAVFSR